MTDLMESMKKPTFCARMIIAALAAGTSGLAAAMVIVVGQVAPLTGLDASQGRAYGAGMQLYFSGINKSGGVNNHTFKFVRKDDAGKPEDTQALTAQILAEDKAHVLAGYFGARNLNQLVTSGILEKERVALVGYRTTEIRPDTPLLFNVRAGLNEEISKIIRQLTTTGTHRFGLLYEDNSGAGALVAFTEAVAKKNDASVVVKAAYPSGSTRVSAAVKTFMATPPEVILMISSGAAAATFIELFRGAEGKAKLVGHAGIDIEQLSKRLGEEQMQGIALTQVTPNPYKIGLKLSREFIDIAAKTPNLEVPVSYAMMEGYITARVIAEAVRKVDGRPTREAIATSLAELDNFDLGGYVITFKNNGSSGSKFVETSIISDTGRIRQ
jgi:branched-chain amino acid transport system substrate-binding protein